MTYFRRLTLQGWRQFTNVDINLGAQTTVLTGANGCGKTSILNVLGRHFGWNVNFVATPYLSKTAIKKYHSDLRRLRKTDLEVDEDAVHVGSIQYDNQSECKLYVPNDPSDKPQYQLQYKNQQNVVGLHIPSHRPAITYQKVQQIPTDPKTSQQHFQDFFNLMLQTVNSSKIQNPGMVLKQSLVALGMFGYSSDVNQGNPEYRALFSGFEEVLRLLLPEEIDFKKLELRQADVVLKTSSGDFSLDAMSGGINSIVGLAWQIYMYGADKDSCTVIIDEPENHLHPKMQRTLLPNLSRAFPKHRFIVATHSPFVVSSDPNSTVIGLVFEEPGSIESRRLETRELAGSANNVLREILDVPSTLPVWVETKIEEILKRYEGLPDSEENARKIYSEMKQQGLIDVIGEHDDRPNRGS